MIGAGWPLGSRGAATGDGRAPGWAGGIPLPDAALLQITLETMDLGVVMVGADGRVEICNGRAIALLDLPPDLMARRPLFADVQRCLSDHNNFGTGDQRPLRHVRDEAVISLPQADEWRRSCGMAIEVRSMPVAGGGMVCTFNDITDRKRTEERARFLAYHDDLTRLLNRAGFSNHLSDAISSHDTSGRSFALMYLDLDHFKAINDTKGHAIGDRLLQCLSARLLASVREGDVVARIGGDEFCVIAHNIETRTVAMMVADRLLRTVGQPCDIDGQRLRVGISIGVALFPEHGTDIDVLTRGADTALYAVKNSSRNAWQIFSPVSTAAAAD